MPAGEEPTPLLPARTLTVGLLAGVGSGLFGVGGGIVMVPLLTAWISLSQHEAHATSLAAILPLAVVGASVFALHGEVDLHKAIALGLGSAIAAPVGAKLMHGLGEWALTTLFGVLLIAVAARLLILG